LAIFLAASVGNAQESPVALLQPTGQEQSFRGYLSSYSFWDNELSGAAALSHPQRREFAGGVGTYSNPVTLAVGHVLQGSEAILDFPAGTRFYLPRLRKYAISEDICRDADDSQASACHFGKNGLPWLYIYIDGNGMRDETTNCARKITGIQTFVMDPGPNYSVVVGEITQSGCNTFPDL